MQETRVRSLGQEDPLEKVMVTHSSILAWEISWIEEPGGRGASNPSHLSPSPGTPLLESGSTAEAPTPPQDPAFSLLIGSGLLAAKFSLVKTDARHFSPLQSLVNSEEKFRNVSERQSPLQSLLAGNYCQS